MKYCLDVKHCKGAEYRGDDSNWERSSRGREGRRQRGEDVESTDCHDGDDDVSLLLTFSV